MEYLTSFEGPTDWCNDYGSRVRDFLYPPADGAYTFWTAGDDEAELYLSVDKTLARKALVARMPGWATPRWWDRYPS